MFKPTLRWHLLIACIIHLADCVVFYNPPVETKPPLVLKILLRDKNVVLEPLEARETRQVINELAKQNMFEKASLLKKDRALDKFEEELRNESPIRKILDHYKRNKLQKMKKVLVKRVVPHSDAITNKLEYDHEYKTYFRPLFRVHKKVNREDILKEWRDFEKLKPEEQLKKWRDSAMKNQKAGQNKFEEIDDNQHLLEPFQVNPKSKTYFKSLREDNSDSVQGEINGVMDDVVQLIKVDANEPQLANNAQKLQTQVSKLLKQLNIGRSAVIGDSFTQLEAQRQPDNEPGEVTELPHVYDRPHHFFFEFWNYPKNIYADGCPGNQVKIGNVCSWIPPH